MDESDENYGHPGLASTERGGYSADQVPSLLAEIRALRAENEVLKDLVQPTNEPGNVWAAYVEAKKRLKGIPG